MSVKPRLAGIQSEPNSVDISLHSNSSSSPSTAHPPRLDMKTIPYQKLKHNSNSVDVPNVPPFKEKKLSRTAVGNAIAAATIGMTAISIDSRHSSGSSSAFSSRPSTSASGISTTTILLGLHGKRGSALIKAPTLTCSSSEDSEDPPHVYKTTSSSSLPAQTISVYQQNKTQLETDPNVQREIALGKRIGFYRLGKELGAGNFSKVKLGIHSLTKEKVAVKIMDKSKMDQKAQRLLSREVANMESLHHPNVIRLFEVIETLSKMYLIMEYAGGGELYTYVHDHGKLTEEQAKPIFAQLVSAVGHLHTKKIVHRDIKAENVIFSQPGWVKLADFGFSCKYEEDTRLTTFCGSPPYAAPELFRDPNYSGPKVDMWALGVTLYFMLVGVTPFRGETVQILKANVIMGSYHMPDYISGFAQYVIQRLLCMDPMQRATTHDLKKMYWLSQSKFPDSYLQISMQPSEDSLKTDRTEQEVWAKLLSIGIDEKMIKASAGKGAKDSIIGTYRIILYQCQAPEHDKERNKVRDHVHKLAERNRRLQEEYNKNSKTCTII